ncbi:PLP-dependent aminotransferase family protein [Paenibacillus hunanensis]|uniref:MocR-like pyridoxine biosynthesis transcription factor PdxR n=1 Tax=Paenibacillus hunanensis TaxID=539262 RepID=UPI00202741CA|nr:PLP-dependent aminotransferase family protein [Paenibacillus hunanensis]MCL9661237.1 PLP-dependent aminotransferase family protein [Paenibacillus hunanensis]
MQEITIAYQRLLEQHGYKYVALYHALREGILNGTLPARSRLPSTRSMAEMYGVSRGIVAEAYDLLLAEGYVEAAVGKGTYVSEQVVVEHSHRNDKQAYKTDFEAKGKGSIDQQRNDRSTPTLSRWGHRIVQLDARQSVEPPNGRALEQEKVQLQSQLNSFPAHAPISFCPQDLVLQGNSLADWKTALTGASQDMQSAAFTEEMSTIGDMRLREAICTHVGRTRGIRARPEQVMLYSGSQEALVLLCQLLINEQEPVVVEDPCYTGIQKAVGAAGGKLIGAPLDRQGILPADWSARLLFVTPGRQFPTGAVLPLARRQQLLQWADRQNAWIVEDDYDSEFRWGGRPLEPLKALDHSEQVIYVGSFSKSMFSSLRIGYAIVPPALIAPLIAAKSLYAPLPSSPLEQRALARFMQRGDYMRHLRRMTRLYRPRFQELHRLLNGRLSELFDWIDTDSGLHIYGSWRLEHSQYERFREQALELGVQWKDASLYQIATGAPAVCFSFAHTDEQQMQQGMERLELAWQRTLE